MNVSYWLQVIFCTSVGESMFIMIISSPGGSDFAVSITAWGLRGRFAWRAFLLANWFKSVYQNRNILLWTVSLNLYVQSEIKCEFLLFWTDKHNAINFDSHLVQCDLAFYTVTVFIEGFFVFNQMVGVWMRQRELNFSKRRVAIE